MESAVKVFGHPVHPILVTFPIGLLATGLLFDLIGLFFDAEQFARAAYYMIPAGILSGLGAALFGLIDWRAIPHGTRAKSVGLQHLIVNVIALLLFALSWFLRGDTPHDPDLIAIILALFGGAILSLGGWLGGELVDRLGVGVDRGANLNAPSSLSGRPAGAAEHPVGGSSYR